MARIVGGAGKGPMSDAAYRGQQAYLGAKQQLTAQQGAQNQQMIQGVQQGLGMAEQNAQQQQGMALQAAKADLEYDPASKTYKPTAQAAAKAQADIDVTKAKAETEQLKAETEQAKAISQARMDEIEALQKVESAKLDARREDRLTEQMYLDFEQKTNDQVAKYDKDLAGLLQGVKTGEVGDIPFLMAEAKTDPKVAAMVDGVRAGSPEAVNRAFTYLKNKVSMLNIQASAVTGRWPHLDPNSTAGQAWNEHYAQFSEQTRAMASEYLKRGMVHPLGDMPTRQQQRFMIEGAARTFLPIFSMRVARLSNGPGTGTAPPGAQSTPSKFGEPNPQPQPGQQPGQQPGRQPSPSGGPQPPSGPGAGGSNFNLERQF